MFGGSILLIVVRRGKTDRITGQARRGTRIVDVVDVGAQLRGRQLCAQADATARNIAA